MFEKTFPTLIVAGRLIAVAAALLLAGQTAQAQTSSLFAEDLPINPHPINLANSSWLYQAPEPLKPIKMHDVITVIVDEKSQMISGAQLQRRKQGQLNAQLQNWVKADGLNLTPAPMNNGPLQANGTLQGQFRAQSDLDTRDSLKFRISATVVDIRPNGHIVLEAHRTIKNNDEQWDMKLSGIVRPEDVLPNNTVLSEDVAELSIFKREQGNVRDGYRRGWLFLLIDKYGLF